MGFMAGFGASVSKGIDRAVEAKNQRDDDVFKYSFQSYLQNKEKLTLREEKEAEMASYAKSKAEFHKQPEEAWKQVYDWKKAGWSDADIDEALATNTITPIKAAAKVSSAAEAQSAPEAASIPTMDDQMADTGLAPKSAPKSSMIDQATSVFGFSRRDPKDAMKEDFDRNVTRIAEVTGEDPSVVSRTLSSNGKPSVSGDGKAGSFTLVAKDVPAGEMTEAKLLSRYAKLKDDVAKGVEGAEARLKVMDEVTIPNWVDAQKRLNPVPVTGDQVLPDLLYRANKAREAGNVEEYQSLSEQIKAQEQAIEMRSDKGGPDFEPAAVFLPNGKTEVKRVRKTRNEAGESVYEDVYGNEVGGTVDKLDKEQQDTIQKIGTARRNEIAKHEESLANAAGAARLTDEVFELVQQDDRVITRAAGMAKSAVGLVKEFGAGVDIISKTMADNGQMTAQEAERALSPGIAKLNESIEAGNFDDVQALAARRALLESKMLLSAFRIGALEGQSGAGMSNADYSRVQEILQNSGEAPTFKKNWADYMAGRFANVDARAEIANNFNADLDQFEAVNKFRPFDYVTVSMRDYANKTEDQKVKRGYQLVEKFANEPFNPGAPARTETAPQTEPTAEPQFLGSKGGYDYFMVNGQQKRRPSKAQ